MYCTCWSSLQYRQQAEWIIATASELLTMKLQQSQDAAASDRFT